MSVREKILDKGSLKILLTDDGFAMLERMRDRTIARWNAEQASGQDAFQTLRAVHRKEGKVEGLREFFETLEKEALQ